MDKIYAIMTFTKLECSEKGWPDFGSTNCCGWYKDEWAFNAVENNALDIHETCYDYAVIEAIPEGLYPSSTERWFYKYNPDVGKYVPIEEPSFMKHFCGLIM